MSWVLVKELIRSHKGKFVFRRKKDGKVSFSLVFPVKAPTLIKKTGQPGEEPERSKWITAFLEPPAEAIDAELDMEEDAGELSGPDVGNRRVLVVEANEEFRSYLVEVLGRDYSVEIAGDGESALEKIELKPPHLVLANVTLPELMGKDLCTLIKSNMKTLHVPVILFMMPTEESDIYYQMADYCFVLPFNITLLKMEIRNLIANRELLKRKYLSLALGKEQETRGDSEIEKLSPKEEKEFKEKVDQLIEENLSNGKFTLGDLADKMNMSRSTLYGRFRAFAHQPPSQYVRSIRLKKALELVLSREYSIAEISDMLGFSDTKYFRKVFKEQFGDAPTKLLNNL